MSTHTPGPWFVGAQNDALYIIDRQPAHSNDHPNHAADTEMVAKPFSARGCTVEANARLIVAAPDLLEALKLIADVGDRAAAEIARTAIAKATTNTNP